MIRRAYEGGWLLIPQTAHAWVAGQLALHWRPGSASPSGDKEPFARPALWEELTMIAAQHDNGWAEWELAPRIGPDGRPVGFMALELEEHFAIWQRSVERMQPTSLYGALLISMHATALYEHRLREDEQGDTLEVRQRIRGFVDEQRAFQEGVRRALAKHPRYGPALAERPLADAFRLLQVWDLLSLMLFKNSLRGPTLEDVPTAPGQRTTLRLAWPDQRTLKLEPYPFDTAPFTVRADGRWVAQRTFGHNALLRRALDEAQVVEIAFVIER